MYKKTASIIGIVLGIVIIIVGFCVMNPETYTVGDPFIKFGGDFYTEMYDVTREVGGAVQRAYKNICNAIGWLIVAIGLVDIAYFICKMASCGENYSGNNYNAAPTTASTYTTQNQATPSVSVSAPVATEKNPNKANEPISAEIKDGEKVCPQCGTAQRVDRRVCWSCGQLFDN